MEQADLLSGMELTPDEAASIEGGDYYKAAAYITACFGAGFHFGFNTLGPLIFG